MAENVYLSRNASAVAKQIVESLRIKNIPRPSVPRAQPISDVFMSLNETQPVEHRARGHPLIELTQRWALQAQSKFRLPNQDELQILSDTWCGYCYCGVCAGRSDSNRASGSGRIDK